MGTRITEEQLNLLRLSNRLQVREALIDHLLALVRKSTPEPDRDLLVIASRMRDAIQSMKFSQMDAATSTLAQAEYEEAIEGLLRDLNL